MANSGKDFELLVGEIEKAYRPFGAKVLVDEKIDTKYGTRQFDVTVRLKVLGKERLILIEAKDYKTKPSVEKVEAFIQKCRHVPNSEGIMVSRGGFSKPSIEQARDYHVTLKQIAVSGGTDWAREIKLPFHVEEFRVTGIDIYVKGINGSTLPADIKITEEIKLRLNDRIKGILENEDYRRNNYSGAYKDSAGLFSLVNGNATIELEISYKVNVTRTLFAGEKAAIDVLGYENLNESKFELIRYGQRIDENVKKDLIDLGDSELPSPEKGAGMGIVGTTIDSFLPLIHLG